jgi:hypothetical protein
VDAREEEAAREEEEAGELQRGGGGERDAGARRPARARRLATRGSCRRAHRDTDGAPSWSAQPVRTAHLASAAAPPARVQERSQS